MGPILLILVGNYLLCFDWNYGPSKSLFWFWCQVIFDFLWVHWMDSIDVYVILIDPYFDLMTSPRIKEEKLSHNRRCNCNRAFGHQACGNIR